MENWGQSRTAPFCQSLFLTLFPCFNVGPSEGPHTFRNIYTHVGPPEDAVLQEISICSTVVLHRLQSLCSSAWSTSFPPPLTMISQGCSSHIFPHSSLPQSFFPFLKYIFPEALPAWLRGSAVSCMNQLEASGTVHVHHRSPQSLHSHRHHSTAPMTRAWAPAPRTTWSFQN